MRDERRDNRQQSNGRQRQQSNGRQQGDRPQMFYAFVISASHDGEKKFWNRIGSAWVNRDGSINIKLFAVPVDGEIQLRIPQPREEGESA